MTYALPNLTTGATGGIDEALVDVVTAVPSFIPMTLVFVYLTILLGGVVRQKRRFGTADIPMWATIAGLGTLTVTLLLSLKEGLMQPYVLSIVAVLTIFSGIWLFFDRNRNEI